MLGVYLRAARVILLTLGILYALWYSFGAEAAVGILCGALLFDMYISEAIDKMKGNK